LWPSLFSSFCSVAGGDYAEHRLILGTHTADGEQNHLCLAVVRLPTEDTEIDARKYDDERGELGGYGGSQAKIEVNMWMNHEGEVNRARYCPQNPFLIATKTPGTDVLVFDYSKHPSRPGRDDRTVRPQVRCKGHDKEGYGIAWNSLASGHLLSGSDDKNVCMWDVSGSSSGSGAGAAAGGGAGAGAGAGGGAGRPAGGGAGGGCVNLDPIFKVRAHADVVEDVAWHRLHKDVFATVGDDKALNLWDARDVAAGPRSRVANAHAGDVMAVNFNPFSEFLVLTGGTDKLVKLWDSRNLRAPVHTFVSHEDDVLAVQWAPFNEALCASAGADRRVMVWDLSRIGAEQQEEDAEDGPPELLVSHKTGNG
jgi:WD40 repeat protein